VSVFEYSSYKTYLTDLVSTKIKVTELAEMAGSSRSYFSQMLNGKAQLTSDHIINLSENLDFTELEKEYFINLCLLERSALPTTKEFLEKKLSEIRQKSLILSQQIKSDKKSFEFTDEMKGEYYSNWLYVQIHIMTSIEEFQTIEAIAIKLKVENKTVRKIINHLAAMNLVKKEKQNYIYQSGNLHVPHQSAYNLINQTNWRMKALQKITDENGIHYTSTFTISKKDVAFLKSQLLDFIKKQRDSIGSSGSEAVYCFNCDFFESN
jgi:uncharacterized protein (TIGR02147 family)